MSYFDLSPSECVRPFYLVTELTNPVTNDDVSIKGLDGPEHLQSFKNRTSGGYLIYCITTYSQRVTIRVGRFVRVVGGEVPER